MTLTLEAPATTAGDPHREALEQVCDSHQKFRAFLRSRVDLHYRNASDHETRTGRLAHKDRATASEVQYLLQQFERTLG